MYHCILTLSGCLRSLKLQELPIFRQLDSKLNTKFGVNYNPSHAICVSSEKFMRENQAQIKKLFLVANLVCSPYLKENLQSWTHNWKGNFHFCSLYIKWQLLHCYSWRCVCMSHRYCYCGLCGYGKRIWADFSAKKLQALACRLMIHTAKGGVIQIYTIFLWNLRGFLLYRRCFLTCPDNSYVICTR